MRTFPFIATAALALALPAGASAHSPASPQSVRAHVRSADAALTKVERLVAGNQDAGAAVAMARNQFETRAAAREAGRLRGGPRRATALRLVARLQDENLATFAKLVDEVDAAVQEPMADALAAALAGRERALSTLTALAPTLPAPAQRGVARAIAALSGDRTDEVAQLLAAMGSGRISAAAQPVVAQALSNAAAGIAMGMSRLQEVLGTLPPQSQAPVQQAMDRLAAILQDLASGVGVAPTTGAPSAGGPVSGLPVPSVPVPTGSLPVPSLPVPLADLPIPGGIASFLEGLFGPRI